MPMPGQFDMQDKVAIVVGGGARGDGIGNGRAAAILMAADGAKVLVVDLDEALANRTAAMIAENGGTAAAMTADVTQAAECIQIGEKALSLWGRVDALDNNVCIGSSKSILEETD